MRSAFLILFLALPAWALSPEFIGKWFTVSTGFNRVTIEEGVSPGVDAAMNLEGGSGTADVLLACRETLAAGKLPRLDCDTVVNEVPFSVEVELQSPSQAVYRHFDADHKPQDPLQLSKQQTAQLPTSSHTGLAPEFQKAWARNSSDSFEYRILVEESLDAAPSLVSSGQLYLNQRKEQIFSKCVGVGTSKTRVFCSPLMQPIREDEVATLAQKPEGLVYYLELLSKSFLKLEVLKSVGGGGPVWQKFEMEAAGG